MGVLGLLCCGLLGAVLSQQTRQDLPFTLGFGVGFAVLLLAFCWALNIGVDRYEDSFEVWCQDSKREEKRAIERATAYKDQSERKQRELAAQQVRIDQKFGEPV